MPQKSAKKKSINQALIKRNKISTKDRPAVINIDQCTIKAHKRHLGSIVIQ